MNEIDIKNCEQAKSGDCCYCKNMAYKILELKLKKIKKIAKIQTSSGCSIKNKECDYSCNICHKKALSKIIQIIEGKTNGR